MKHLLLALFASLLLVACGSGSDNNGGDNADGGSWQDDKEIDKDKV